MAAHKRLPANVTAADRAALLGIAELGEYSPPNGAYSLAALRELDVALSAAQQAESRAYREAEAARRQANEAANALHEAVKGARAQIYAQYGPDSLALHNVGLKTVSEYKSRARTTRKAAPKE